MTALGGHFRQTGNRLSEATNLRENAASPAGGEEGVPLVACAVGNAIVTLTGVRLRELPFSPDRVRGALGA